MQIFYNPTVELNPILEEEEARHCIQVLRHKGGDIIYVANGHGKLFECTITLAEKKKCTLAINKIVQQQYREREINIVVAPTKQMERMEWMAEKCAELGAASFTFIDTEHSERKNIKPERLEKILIGAMKQSMNLFLPVLHPMVKFKEFIKNGIEGEKYICHKQEDTGLLYNLYNKTPQVTILIGPEGDFTPKEIEAAINAGFTPALLGNYRLRTETACIAAVQQLMLK